MEADHDRGDFVAYVNRSLDSEEEFHFLRFEFLQRLNIVHLQVDLVRMKSRFQRVQSVSTNDLTELKTVLKDYVTAIRDYQYLRNKKSVEKTEMRKRKLLLQRFFQSQDDFNDPFQSHYSYIQDTEEKFDPLRDAVMQFLPPQLTYSHHERMERKREYNEGKAPKIVSEFVDRLVRFMVAFTGGVFLVVPMIIMVFGPSRTKSLVTVSVSVTLFALILSFGVRVSNVETLVSTATYAAVLVVFVGTSGTNSP